MHDHTVIDDLYRYHAWANERVFRLCDGLVDDQLDEPRELGMGSLRKTLFHILAAEELWLDRWRNQPWRPLSADPVRMPLRARNASSRSNAEHAAPLRRHTAVDGLRRLAACVNQLRVIKTRERKR